VSKEKKMCKFSKHDKVMLRIIQVIAVVCLVDIAYTLWRCMG